MYRLWWWRCFHTTVFVVSRVIGWLCLAVIKLTSKLMLKLLPNTSTCVEVAVFPIVLLAVQVNEPLSLRRMARTTRVPLWTENLSEKSICFPCLSQKIEGSGIPDAVHVISRRTPDNTVTRVPIWTETGLKLVICSTEVDEASIFGSVPSIKRKVISAVSIF